MASTSVTVAGNTAATATQITGLSDGTEYAVQNRLLGELFGLSKASQPTDADFPARFGAGSWFTIIARAGENYYVWRGANAEDATGRIYVEEVGSA